MIQPILDEITSMEEDESLWEIASDGENAFISTNSVDTPNTKARENSALTEIQGKDISSNSILAERGMPKGTYVALDCDAACEVLVRAFQAAAEREITIGDGLDVWIIKKQTQNSEAITRLGRASSDTNEYLLEKRRFSLPTH